MPLFPNEQLQDICLSPPIRSDSSLAYLISIQITQVHRTSRWPSARTRRRTIMQMLQMFETTVFSEYSEHALHALSVPSRSFAGTNFQVQVDTIVAALGLQKLTPTLIAPFNLGPALAVLSSPSVAQSEVIVQVLATLQAPGQIPIPPVTTAADAAFGTQVNGENFVPSSTRRSHSIR